MERSPPGRATLNARIDGDDRAPLLVLAHGLGLDLTMWTPQMPSLARRYRVLRYDARGHGASPDAVGPCTIDRLGRDVLDLLDDLGAERTHFCGFSMGGQIGIWLGIHASERLDKLVLAHTAAWIGPQSMWNARIATVNRGGMAAISDAAMQRWFTPEFLAREPGTVAALKDVFERTSPAGYVQCCAAIRDADFRDALGAIATPTLVLSGTGDVATTHDDGRFLAARIADAQFASIDAAHLSNYEQPAAFTAALLAFLDAGSGARAAALSSSESEQS
jgi:3-oxoadipate enol-lactonase